MTKKENVTALYKDAIVSHLLRKGYSEFTAEQKARRMLESDDTL